MTKSSDPEWVVHLKPSATPATRTEEAKFVLAIHGLQSIVLVETRMARKGVGPVMVAGKGAGLVVMVVGKGAGLVVMVTHCLY